MSVTDTNRRKVQVAVLFAIIALIMLPFAPVWGWAVGEYGRRFGLSNVVSLTVFLLPWIVVMAVMLIAAVRLDR